MSGNCKRVVATDDAKPLHKACPSHFPLLELSWWCQFNEVGE